MKFKLNEKKMSALVKYIIKESNINKKYTHFAVRKSDNKIVNGWEYKNLDKESIIEYCKIDLKDQFPDCKFSDYKIVTKAYLEKENINPFDTNNWFKYDI